jgi:hypothetical protein
MFNLAETVETVTIVEAAELCGRHHDTVKRRVERRDFPGAFQGNDRNRTWHIPLDDLIASGMLPGGENGAQASGKVLELHRPEESGSSSSVAALAYPSAPPALISGGEVIGLQQLLVERERELAVARAFAEERLATIALLRELLSAGVR